MNLDEHLNGENSLGLKEKLKKKQLGNSTLTLSVFSFAIGVLLFCIVLKYLSLKNHYSSNEIISCSGIIVTSIALVIYGICNLKLTNALKSNQKKIITKQLLHRAIAGFVLSICILFVWGFAVLSHL